MEFLTSAALRPEPGERVFRHGLLGPLALWSFLAAPLAGAVFLRAELLSAASSVPGVAWLVLGPVLFLVGCLWCLLLVTLGQIAHRATLPSNWLMRVSPAGLALNLRSYQNAHFADDGPTIARIAWDELARVRAVHESTTRLGRGGEVLPERRRWLELELRRPDTETLERLVASERQRRGPEGSFLGVRTCSRSQHVPVFVARPGLVRVDWLGSAALAALARHVPLGEAHTLELDSPGADLDTRLRALLARGQRMAAYELAQRELGLGLGEARAHVAGLERQRRAA